MDCIEGVIPKPAERKYNIMNFSNLKLAYIGALNMPQTKQNEQSSVWLLPFVRDIVSIGVIAGCVTFAVIQDRRVSHLEYQDTQAGIVQKKLEAFLDKEAEKADKIKSEREADAAERKAMREVLIEMLYEMKVAPARRERLIKRVMPNYNGQGTKQPFADYSNANLPREIMRF